MTPRVRELVVFMEGRRAGTLSQDGPILRFSYDQTYRSDRLATPLSLSMPLAIENHPNRVIRPWIAGLLPDNDQVLTRWARQFQVSVTPFALLGTQIGTDCAGAVQFIPMDRAANFDPESGSVEWLSDEQVAQRLRDLQTDPASWLGVDFEGRFSLAGAQAKTALLLRNGQWGIPSGAVATTHILKPAINGFDDHDLNEHLCLRAAAILGMPAANTALRSFASERAVVVERYDRVPVDGVIRRVHQEDLCQALSVDPSLKYQSDGGPGPKDIAALIRDVMNNEKAARTVGQFADALIFNWAIGGTDAHAKNYSLLLHRERVDLAPLYDVASALPYETTEHKLRLAMKIRSDYYLTNQRPQLWSRLASTLRLPVGALRARAAQMLESIPAAFTEACADPEVSALDSSLPTRLVETIEEQVKVCLRSLSEEVGD